MVASVLAIWKTIAQFAIKTSFTQTPNDIDSGAPPVKFSLNPSFRAIVRRSCFGWH
jgi:hypothetical protein